MAKRTSNEEAFEQVLSSQLPRYKRARATPRQDTGEARSAEQAEAQTPDVDTIRQKLRQFVGGGLERDTAGTGDLLKRHLSGGGSVRDGSADTSQPRDDLQITAVRKKKGSEDVDSEAAPKAAVWSRGKRRVEGMQG